MATRGTPTLDGNRDFTMFGTNQRKIEVDSSKQKELKEAITPFATDLLSLLFDANKPSKVGECLLSSCSNSGFGVQVLENLVVEPETIVLVGNGDTRVNFETDQQRALAKKIIDIANKILGNQPLAGSAQNAPSLEEVFKANQELNEKVKRLEKSQTSLNKKFNNLEKDNESLRLANAQLAEDLKDHRSLIKQMQEYEKTLVGNNQDLENALEEATNAKDQAEKEIAGLKTQLGALQQQIASLEARLTATGDLDAAHKKSLDELRNQLDEANRRQAAAEQRALDAEARATTAERQLSEKNDELARIQRELDALRASNESADKALKALQKKDPNATWGSLVDRINRLLEENERLQVENQTVKATNMSLSRAGSAGSEQQQEEISRLKIANEALARENHQIVMGNKKTAELVRSLRLFMEATDAKPKISIEMARAQGYTTQQALDGRGARAISLRDAAPTASSSGGASSGRSATKRK